MKPKMIAISLSPGLIRLIDAEAYIHFENRSEYIKRAVITRMEKDGLAARPDRMPRTRDEVDKQRLREFLNKIAEGGFAEDADDLC